MTFTSRYLNNDKPEKHGAPRDDNRTRARLKLLRWMANKCRPVSTDEIRVAMGYRTNWQAYQLLDHCELYCKTRQGLRWISEEGWRVWREVVGA